MSFLDYIPGVAHVKALTHLIFNDEEGAIRTMDTLHTKTPIVSHLMAGVAKMAGDDDLAKKRWDGGNNSLDALPVVGHVKGLGHYVFLDIEGGNKAMVDATTTTLNIADGIPVVGHAKGIVHYTCGDIEGGNKAMKASTRTTFVMGGGAIGFLGGGPAGAVAGGVTVGAEWDLLNAAVTNGEEVNGIAQIVKNPTSVDSYFNAGLGLLGDGLAGYSGGKIAENMVGPSEMGSKAVSGDTGTAAAGGEAKAAAAQKLVEAYEAGDISWNEYNQKWNAMKPKASQAAKAVKQSSAIKVVKQPTSTNTSFIGSVDVSNSTNPTSTASNGDDQPPQQPTKKNNSNSANRDLELEKQLKELLKIIRERMRQDPNGRQETFQEFQRETFHQIFRIFSGLLSIGYTARIQQDGNFEIFSPDGSPSVWSEVIGSEVVNYLRVNDQLINQQFEYEPLRLWSPRQPRPCPTVLSATFGPNSQLVLSREQNHRMCRVIYGIRCRICRAMNNRTFNGNVNYVGQSVRSIHNRVCTERPRPVANAIEEIEHRRRVLMEESEEDEDFDLFSLLPHLPTIEHAAFHLNNNHLPAGTDPMYAFRLVMDVIRLPIGDGELTSWEQFWQFFFQCRRGAGGWSIL